MKHYIYIILTVLTFRVSAQTINKEDFLNSIYEAFVDSSFTQYNLLQSSAPLTIHNFMEAHIHSDFSKFFSKKELSKIILKSHSDTLPLIWKCGKLKLAKCVSKDSMDQIIDDPIRNTIYNKSPKQNRTIYKISRPIFSDNGEFAIISQWCYKYYDIGKGCIYLFRKNKGKWEKLSSSACAVN